MKINNQNQKGAAMIWVVMIVIIVIIAIVAVTYISSRYSRPLNCCHGEQYQVTIMVPNDLSAYEKAMINFTQEGVGSDPSKTFPFVSTTTTPNTLVANPLQNAAEAAAEVIPTQAGTSSVIVYLKVVNGTAYVLLKMNIDGWAGVSFANAEVDPIVEKTLLAQPGITAVKFSPAPGDNIDNIMKNYTMSETYVKANCQNGTPENSLDGWTCMRDKQSSTAWKTYVNKAYRFTFKYPANYSLTTYSDNVADVDFGMSPKAKVVASFGGISPNVIAPPDCYSNTYASPVKDYSKTTVINGTTFHYGLGGDQGMGQAEKIFSYSADHNGKCYEIALTETWGRNSDNTYTPQFDQGSVEKTFEQILSTFKFTN